MTTGLDYSSSKLDEQLIEQKARSYKWWMTETVVKGKSPPSRARRMLDITGVMELWDSGRFEAAVHTKEGPTILKGKVARKRSSTQNIQPAPMIPWQPTLEEADEAIRFAYDNLVPAEALKTISIIWEHLDRTSELASARSRLLMGKMNRPPLADLPGWFTDQERGLLDQDEGELAANPLAIESSRLLVRAALASVDDNNELEAELETGPLGRVTIDWHIAGSRFQWMIEAVDQPWPSAKVYQLAHRADGDGPTTPETRVFHNAYDAIESFAEFVHGK